MLGERLDKREQTTLSVEPGVSSKLLLERLETLDNSADSEVVVALGTVEGTDDQVDDAKVEYLLVWFVYCNTIFLFFHALHKLFGIGILACHDIGHTEVC